MDGCFREYADQGVVIDLDDLDADLFAWASHLQARGGAGWILKDQEGTLVASVGFAMLSEHSAELKRLYLHRDHRGSGLADKLVHQLESAVRAAGGRRVEAWSDTKFKRAHAFYQRMGYVMTGKTRALHDISNTTEYLFQKAL